MTDLQIAWLELVLVGGGGVLLLLAGITVKVVQSTRHRIQGGRKRIQDEKEI